MAAVKRSARVGERLREELSMALARRVQDPRVEGVAITGVTMTDDLQLAKILFRVGPPDTPTARRAAESGLASASGVLRREIGKRLGLRYAPRLVFRYDEGVEQRHRIDALLAEVSLEERARDASRERSEDDVPTADTGAGDASGPDAADTEDERRR